MLPAVSILLAIGLFACSGGASGPAESGPPPAEASATADVTKVRARAAGAAYTFSVTVKSPDTGCERFADWWEVVGEDGRLRYRRILLHSHVAEQPFTRSGGPVSLGPEEVVWVRAHLSTGGYGAAMRGTVAGGFVAATPPDGFGAGLERVAPQPEGCAF